MRKKSFARARLYVATAAALSQLAGCQGLPGVGAGVVTEGEFALRPAQAVLALKADPSRYRTDTVERQIVAEGIKALKANELERASRIFNAALKLNVTKSELHLLNALTYHLQALAGDSSKFEMAEEGYRIALRFDPTNWLAEYQLGLCYLDQRKFSLAQLHLARAAVAEHRDPDLMLDLATASYYARDPRIAEGVLKRLAEIAPERAREPVALRAAIMTKAALNDTAAVERLLGEYRKVARPDEARYVERRLQDWGQFYKTSTPQLLAQFPPPGGSPFPPAPTPGPIPGVPGGFPPQPGGGLEPAPMPAPMLPGGPPQPGFPGPTPAPFAGAGPFADDKMVVVDVVLIGTQEDARRTYGINLLNGLRLQFGDPVANTPAFSRSSTYDNNIIDPVSSSWTHTVTRDMRIPSITYSLNIANALDDRDEIIAKPSLVALAGQTSEFFSGTEISAAAVSGGAGDSVSVQKEVGVKLAVRPEFLPDGKIRLQVVAQRTFLTDPSSSVVFQFRLDTTKTTVNANVVMRFGETLILSGLTERETSRSVDGVPFLRDIPALNLLFSQRDQRDFRKSILILLTPRRPIYGAQSPDDRKALLDSLNEYEKSIARLEQRHKDWFRPRATFDEIREKLDSMDMRQEFRSGDVRSERWEQRPGHGERVNRLLDRIFL